jgi:hypothetical protein
MNNLLLLLLLSFNAHAFINIESLRKNSKPGLNTSGKLLFNQQAGNTDKILASGSTLNSYLKEKDEFIFLANIRYGESFEQKDTEDGSAHFRYTRMFAPKHFIEGYTQYQYNNFKALEQRNIVGLGYRFTGKYFNLGLGAFDEHEEIANRPNEDAIRGNFYLSSTFKK